LKNSVFPPIHRLREQRPRWLGLYNTGSSCAIKDVLKPILISVGPSLLQRAEGLLHSLEQAAAGDEFHHPLEIGAERAIP